MRIGFKLYDIEVVDCSAGFVRVIPKKSNIKILAQMILKIMNSDFIKSIGSIDIGIMDNNGNLYKFRSPAVFDDRAFNSNYHKKIYKLSDRDVIAQTNAISRDIKVYGLYVETIESAKRRKDNIDKIIIPSGLSGIQQVMNLIIGIENNSKNRDFPNIFEAISEFTFLKCHIKIEFIEAYDGVAFLFLDSRQDYFEFRFNSDGEPLPEDEDDWFLFIEKNVSNIFSEESNKINLYSGMGEDEMDCAKSLLKRADRKGKLNNEEFFSTDDWYFSTLEGIIKDDSKTDNVIAIYRTSGPFDELDIIVKDINKVPYLASEMLGINILEEKDIKKDRIIESTFIYGIKDLKEKYN